MVRFYYKSPTAVDETIPHMIFWVLYDGAGDYHNSDGPPYLTTKHVLHEMSSQPETFVELFVIDAREEDEGFYLCSMQLLEDGDDLYITTPATLRVQRMYIVLILTL